MAEEWQQNGTKINRKDAVGNLLTSLQENDDRYLAGTISREAWQEVRADIDGKLAVVGLRLTTVK